jgi:hypothetical protein
MNSLSGKSIRWTFADGPMAGTTFEHLFDDDGSVTWRIVDGPHGVWVGPAFLGRSSWSTR